MPASISLRPVLPAILVANQPLSPVRVDKLPLVGYDISNTSTQLWSLLTPTIARETLVRLAQDYHDHR